MKIINKKMLRMIGSILCTCILVGVLSVPVCAMTWTCNKAGCNNPRVEGSYFCIKHGWDRCLNGNCNNVRYGKSCYCKEHTFYANKKPCFVTGCNRESQSSSSYCDYHYNQKFGGKKKTQITNSKNSPQTTSKNKSSKKKSYKNSYDDGYEDVYMNDDYDWNRYCNDWEYALGVDDALDEEGLDY